MELVIGIFRVTQVEFILRVGEKKSSADTP